MMRYCGTCGARLDDMALASGRCPVCGTPITDPRDAISEAPTQPLDGPLGLESPPLAPATPVGETAWPPAQSASANTGSRGLPSARTLGAFLLVAVLVAVLLALLVQHVGLQFILAPSASSSSSSSSNSNSSSQTISGAAATATAANGGAPTPTAGPPRATPTPRVSPTVGPSPTPGPSPTATPVPATLDIHPTSIQLTTCVAAQTQFTVANTGGLPFSWTASASVTGYTLSPASGTLNGGNQQVLTVSGILLSGTITVTAPSARSSPQQVTITCTL
jgi:Viral BACON domain